MEKEIKSEEPRKIKLADRGSLKAKEEGEGSKEKKIKEKSDKRWIALILIVSVLVTLTFYFLPFIQKRKLPDFGNSEKGVEMQSEDRNKSGYSL